MTTDPVRDFDLHPDEDDVRVFTAQPAAVLRLSDDAYLSAAHYGDVVAVGWMSPRPETIAA